MGLLFSAFYRPAQQKLPAPPPSPAVAPNSAREPESTEATYPAGLDTDPYSIANFLRAHPNAKLGPLWRRLGIPDNNRYYPDDACSYCEPNTFQYNLDDDLAQEVVLQIKEPLAEGVKYLMFKQARGGGNPKLIGHVETWTKYGSSDPVVFASNRRNWLVIQGTAATGTGLGAWVDTVYEVSNGRVKRMASYLARVTQMGNFGFPSREFVASPVAAEVEPGKFILTLACRVEYSGRPLGEPPLFTKQQKVVLVNFLKDRSYYVDEARSDVAAVEFEAVYNDDSMNEADFLRYNRFELFAIASEKDSERKRWLKEFLDTCPNYPVKRELLIALKSSPS